MPCGYRNTQYVMSGTIVVLDPQNMLECSLEKSFIQFQTCNFLIFMLSYIYFTSQWYIWKCCDSCWIDDHLLWTDYGPWVVYDVHKFYTSGNYYKKQSCLINDLLTVHPWTIMTSQQFIHELSWHHNSSSTNYHNITTVHPRTIMTSQQFIHELSWQIKLVHS